MQSKNIQNHESNTINLQPDSIWSKFKSKQSKPEKIKQLNKFKLENKQIRFKLITSFQEQTKVKIKVQIINNNLKPEATKQIQIQESGFQFTNSSF